MVVVRPEYKRAKKKAKRLADPTRKGYISILDNANASGGGDFHALSKEGPKEADGEEAMAVAKAIGLNQGAFEDRKGTERDGEGAPLSRTSSVKSDAVTEDSPSPEGPLIMDDADLEEVPNQSEDLGDPEVDLTDNNAKNGDLEGEPEKHPTE